MPGPQVGPSSALIYFLTLHEPYEDVRDPQPVNATLVDARTLLHPALPQPLAVLARRGGCDALRLGVPRRELILMAHDPTTRHPTTEGGWIGGEERQEVLDHFAGVVAQFAAEGALWPGDDLVPVPTTPERMPYRPYRSTPAATR